MPDSFLSRVKRMAELEKKATRDWTLHRLGSDQYFRYVGNEQVFFPAFHVRGLETLGDCECGAMEEANARFVLESRDFIPLALRKLEQQRKALESHGWKMDDGTLCFCGMSRPVALGGHLIHHPRCAQSRAALADSVEEPK